MTTPFYTPDNYFPEVRNTLIASRRTLFLAKLLGRRYEAIHMNHLVVIYEWRGVKYFCDYIELPEESVAVDGTPAAVRTVVDFVFDLLFAVGLMATALVIGLYYGGFFHWVAVHRPDSIFAWILK